MSRHLEQLVETVTESEQGGSAREPGEHDADVLQAVRLQHRVQVQNDPERHDPAINERRHRKQNEPEPAGGGEKRIFRDLNPQAPPRELLLQDLRCLRTQVGDLQPVEQNIITIEPHERIGIKQHCRQCGNKEEIQAQILEQSRLGMPPECKRQRRQDDLHIHPRCRDKDPLPLVAQHPGIGGIAVERGAEDQQHHPHLVALPAKMLAGQAMPELMEHADNSHRQPEVDQIRPGEKLLELRQPLADVFDTHHQEQGGTTRDERHRSHCPCREQPPAAGMQNRQCAVGVPPRESHAQGIPDHRPERLPLPCPALLNQFPSLSGPLADEQLLLMQIVNQSLHIEQCQMHAGLRLLQQVTEFFEGPLTIEQGPDFILLGLELGVLQAAGVFDDGMGHIAILDPLDHDILPPPQRDRLLRGGTHGGRGSGLHGGRERRMKDEG